jgi:DNA-binding NtrC family response regulator
VKREALLVVDDEEILREFLRETLARAGYAVGVAADGDEALGALERDAYALVLMDQSMPRRDGLDTLGAIRRAHPRLPVVMMTAYGTVESAVAAMRLGAVDYVQKPFDAERVEEVVERVLEVARLREENARRVARLAPVEPSSSLIGRGPAMQQVLVAVRAAAASRSTVLVTGESGTGKELVARAIHEMSPRAARPFIKVNCAAIPEGLLESELFGHERGAFTGAVRSRAGHFEAAHGGTLLLDEVGEAGSAVQAKLLRVIQEREVTRVGDAKTLRVDVRLVATTNRDLRAEVNEGRFRGDLYYRINVIPIHLPPLRDRREEIPGLAEHFARRIAAETGRPAPVIAPEAMRKLSAHAWPGNVRELENVVERAVVLGGGGRIEADAVALDGEVCGAHGALRAAPSAGEPAGTLDRLERDVILATLREENGNRTRTAARLGVSVRTIRNKLSRWRSEGAPLPEVCRAD